MKKMIILLAVCVLALSACATTSEPSGASEASGTGNGKEGIKGVPAFVNETYLNASEDVLVGIGTYKIGGDTSRMSIGKTVAETRARADIARQLQVMVKDMITDYTAASELDPQAKIAFEENITQSLAKADLQGSKIIRMDVVDGVMWVIMEYSKLLAGKDLNAASAAAKLAVPAAAAFDALSRMDTAFDKTAGGGPMPVGE
jgi:hypothetical protein